MQRFFVTYDKPGPAEGPEFNLWIGDKPELNDDVPSEPVIFEGEDTDCLTELDPEIFDLKTLGLKMRQVVEVKSLKLLNGTTLVYGDHSTDAEHLDGYYYFLRKNGKLQAEHCGVEFEMHTFKKIHRPRKPLELTEIRLKKPALN